MAKKCTFLAHTLRLFRPENSCVLFPSFPALLFLAFFVELRSPPPPLRTPCNIYAEPHRYFIRTGNCKVLSPKGEVVCTLVDGDSFGEVALYGPYMRRTATVISPSYCDLDVLLKNDFQTLVHDFPDAQVSNLHTCASSA